MTNLLLLFRIGNERYAIPAVSVLEVIPKVHLQKIQQPPPNIVGQFNYQGQIVPVLDLSQLLGGMASRNVLSTRIVLVNLALTKGQKKLLGLMVEQVTDTLMRDQTQPIEKGVTLSRADYLGEKLLYENSVIQCLQIQHLLPSNVFNQVLDPLENGYVTAESIV